MTLYFDTSAVLPYYRPEEASGTIQSLLDEQTTPVLISQLVEVEMASALARCARTGELTEPQANRIESAFHEDVRERRFLVQAFDGLCFERAKHWLLLRRTSLRTLDALHLACAETNDAALVTLDRVMRESADFFGLKVQSMSL